MTQKREDNVNKEQGSAVLYLRVASADQRDQSDGIRRQRAACMREAERRGFTVVHEFADHGRSTNAVNRAGLRWLLRAINEQPIKYIITSDRVRLARNPADYAVITKRIEQAGATLVFADRDSQSDAVMALVSGGAR